MYKMINQFGNKFECSLKEVKRYLEAFAIFENDKEEAKYQKALKGEVETKKESE